MKPRLVVISGYPSSGKTIIATYMQRELGFERLSSDDYRKMLFGVEHPEFMQDPEYETKEWKILWPLLDRAKADLLYIGRNVVIDSTAGFNDLRRMLLNTRYGNGDIEIEAEKYLLLLRVDRDILQQRDHPESIEIWDSFWEEPVPGDYEILDYPHNTPEDTEAVFSDLKRRFEKRDEIRVPGQ